MAKQPGSPTAQISRSEQLRMGDEDLTETSVLTACRTCGAGLPESNNFCRWCGAHQEGDLKVRRQSQTRLTSPHLIHSPEQRRAFNSPYHPVSGPLVQAIAENVSSTLTLQRRDRLVQGVIQALVSIPIWLMFVLLSPFDAYTAAKNVTRGV